MIISFSSLEDKKKEKLRQLVYIIDKFAISNAAYYELSMLEKSQPKKYLMVQEKEKLDRLFHIETMSENVPGACVKLRD